jgi:hypothetical protein
MNVDADGQAAAALVRRIEAGSGRLEMACAGVRYGRSFWPCRAVQLSANLIGMIADATSPAERVYWLFERLPQGWVAVDSAMWRPELQAYALCRHILSSCTLADAPVPRTRHLVAREHPAGRPAEGTSGLLPQP